MNTLDKKYLDMLRHIQETGTVKKDRTGVGTISVFGYDMRIDLSEGLSLLTTKHVHYPAVIHELLWFLKGSTDIKYLVENDVRIWNEWPFENYRKTNVEDLESGEYMLVQETTFPISKRHFTMPEYLDAIKNKPGFAEKHGSVGKVYGAQWTNWTTPVEEPNFGVDPIEEMHRQLMGNSEYRYKIEGYNQLAKLMDTLRNNPDSRRMLVSAWNAPEMEHVALPCCHYGFQCYTTELTLLERKDLAEVEGMDFVGEPTDEFVMEMCDMAEIPQRKLSMKFHQRSCDSLLGVPFDIASYSVLVYMMCKELNMVPGELIFTGGDTHIYLNHQDQVNLQLSREPYPNLPKLILKGETGKSIFDYVYSDFTIQDYERHPSIKATVAV